MITVINIFFILLILLTAVKYLFFYQLTALHVAASDGLNYRVECLVAKGASVNPKDKDGVSVSIDSGDDRLLTAPVQCSLFTKHMHIVNPLKMQVIVSMTVHNVEVVHFQHYQLDWQCDKRTNRIDLIGGV